MRVPVLIVHNRYIHAGGEEKIIEQQTAQLKNKGHDVQAYFEDSQDFRSEMFLRKIGRIMQLPFSLEHYHRIRKKIKEFRPSLVHVHNVFPLLTPSVYWAAKDSGVPVVQSVHNYRFMCSNGLFLLPDGSRCERCLRGSHLNAIRFRCYNESFLRSAGMSLTLSIHRWLGTFKNKIDAFVAPSEFLKKKLIEGGFPAHKIFRVPAGLLPLSDRSWGQSERTLLFVGRLSREKGLKTLLQAASQIPDWSIQVVGDGPLRDELDSEIESKKLRNVRLLGRLPTSEIEILLQKATALVLPSECYENLPTVILEAWYYGLPVIVSRLGGMAELVEENKTGFLFNPGDAGELADKVRLFGPSKSKSMRAFIQNHFHKNFSVEANYQALMEIYGKVLLS